MKTPHLKHGLSRLPLLLLVLMLFGVGWSVARTSTTSTSEPEPSGRILTTSGWTLQLDDTLSTPRLAIGRVEARRRSSLGFDQAGQIVSMKVNEGDQIAAGEVLAQLDTKRLQAQARQMDAALAEASAIRELRRREFIRQEELRRQNVVSAQGYDQAEQQLAQARATVERIQAERERIDVELEKSTLRAPYAGQISMRFRDEGDVVSAGTPLFEILEHPAWEIRTGLNPSQAAALSVGEQVSIKRSGSQEPFQTKVLRILPRLNDQTRTVDVILQPENSMTPFREGELVEVLLEQRLDQAAFALPSTSLQEGTRGTWVVYLAKPLEDSLSGGPTHRIETRPVQLVGMGTEQVFVEGLIEEGDVILYEGLQKFTPGQSIRLKDAGEDS